MFETGHELTMTLEKAKARHFKFEAADLEKLFISTFLKVMSTVSGEHSQEKSKRTFHVKSFNSTTLYIDFFNEVIGFAFLHQEVYTGIAIVSLSPQEVCVEVEGYKVNRYNSRVKSISFGDTVLTQGRDRRWNADIILNY